MTISTVVSLLVIICIWLRLAKLKRIILDIPIIPIMSRAQKELPCFVLKSTINSTGSMHYPIICETSPERSLFMKNNAEQQDKFVLLRGGIYRSNGVTYGRFVANIVKQYIKDVIRSVNDQTFQRRKELQKEIDDYNLRLPEEIKAHNDDLAARVEEHNKTATKKDIIKLHKSGKRYYWNGTKTYAKLRFFDEDKRSFAKESNKSDYKLLRDIRIIVFHSEIYWEFNDYITCEELEGVILQAHDDAIRASG